MFAIGAALVLGFSRGSPRSWAWSSTSAFVFSGSAGVNPAFIIIGLLPVLAWRNAGWIGLDHFLLRRLGTPWQPGLPSGSRPAG